MNVRPLLDQQSENEFQSSRTLSSSNQSSEAMARKRTPARKRTASPKRTRKPDVFAALRAGNLKPLRDYLKSGGDPNAVDQEVGQSLLGVAAQQGDLKAGKLLLDHGADPNLPTYAWPIHFAAGAGHLEFVELLLDHDSEVFCLDEDGGTPLADAAAGGHEDIVELLLEEGADPKYRDKYGKPAIIYAAEKGHRKIVELLAPYASVRDRRLAELRLKFAGKGRPTEDVIDFQIAAGRGLLREVQKYVESGKDVNAITLGGSTALMSAAHGGQIDVLRYLLEHGADPNLVNENGACALGDATNLPRPEAYELLYPLTDEKLRRSAEKEKQKKMKAGLWK